MNIYRKLRVFFPHRLWFMPAENPPVLYLTFDDGPVPEVTPWLLDELQKYRAKATFFCLGQNIDKHPQLFKRLSAEGHSVGHHTQNHLKGWNTPKDDYLQNMHACAEKVPQPLFRPPYGKITRSQARAVRKAGHRIVMWDVISHDYDNRFSPESCWLQVKKQARNGSIIVFHDSIKAEPRMKYALKKTLAHFSKLGYQFQALNARG